MTAASATMTVEPRLVGRGAGGSDEVAGEQADGETPLPPRAEERNPSAVGPMEAVLLQVHSQLP